MANNRPKTTPQEWIDGAKRLLVERGIDQVKIEALAQLLGVTRGGFYYFFKNRDNLLDRLLRHWQTTNLYFAPNLMSARDAETAREFFDRSQIDLIEETYFDPKYDLAVREWGRRSAPVGRLMAKVDDRRIRTFRRLFTLLGHGREEALIRARITYYHQIGYYAIGVRQSTAARFRYLRIYEKVLSGIDVWTPTAGKAD